MTNSNNEPSKTGGKVKEATGSAKATFGKLIGNHQMEANGHAEHSKGEAEVNAATAKQKGEAAVEGGKGTVQSVIGSLTGNDRQHAEGEARRTHADVKGRTA